MSGAQDNKGSNREPRPLDAVREQISSARIGGVVVAIILVVWLLSHLATGG